jgi:hypothetical protein
MASLSIAWLGWNIDVSRIDLSGFSLWQPSMRESTPEVGLKILDENVEIKGYQEILA